MKSDYDMIIWDFPHLKSLTLRPLGDVHIGSKEFDEKLFLERLYRAKYDENSMLIICGDLLDTGIIGSKTSVYEQTLTPHEQKHYLKDKLKPVANRIATIVPGNHCDRITKQTGINTLYDVACMIGCEDVYREGFAAVRIGVGKRPKDKSKPNVYVGVVSHGASKTKHQKWTQTFEEADFFISGHVHTPSYNPRGKLRIDARNGKVIRTGYKEIVVDAGMDYGGYAVKAEYEPSAAHEEQRIVLSGECKRMRFESEDF